MRDVETYRYLSEMTRLREENATLRRMLALAHAGAQLYTDDGELQDSRAHPCIDFKRDPVEMIREKLVQRNLKKLWEAGIE